MESGTQGLQHSQGGPMVYRKPAGGSKHSLLRVTREAWPCKPDFRPSASKTMGTLLCCLKPPHLRGTLRKSVQELALYVVYLQAKHHWNRSRRVHCLPGCPGSSILDIISTTKWKTERSNAIQLFQAWRWGWDLGRHPAFPPKEAVRHVQECQWSTSDPCCVAFRTLRPTEPTGTCF